jgi:hypothetical protein
MMNHKYIFWQHYSLGQNFLNFPLYRLTKILITLVIVKTESSFLY